MRSWKMIASILLEEKTLRDGIDPITRWWIFLLLKVRTNGKSLIGAAQARKGPQLYVWCCMSSKRHSYATCDMNLISYAGKNVEDQIREIANLFIRRGLLMRCQRKYLKPPPGQKRLIKFPKKVLPVPGQDGLKFDEDGFYAWTYEKPTPPWVYAVSALSAVGVILLCLFPIAPNWVKIGVLYSLAGLLAILIGILIVRGLIALASYIFVGRTVWILPNLLDDDKPVSQLFYPLVAVLEPEIDTRKALLNHVLMRVGVAIAVAGVTYVLYTKSPGQDAVKKNAFKYRDELFEFFNIHNDRELISRGENDTAAVNNTSTTGNVNKDMGQGAEKNEL